MDEQKRDVPKLQGRVARPGDERGPAGLADPEPAALDVAQQRGPAGDAAVADAGCRAGA